VLGQPAERGALRVRSDHRGARRPRAQPDKKKKDPVAGILSLHEAKSRAVHSGTVVGRSLRRAADALDAV
jgi:hypothetical protein